MCHLFDFVSGISLPEFVTGMIRLGDNPWVKNLKINYIVLVTSSLIFEICHDVMTFRQVNMELLRCMMTDFLFNFRENTFMESRHSFNSL